MANTNCYGSGSVSSDTGPSKANPGWVLPEGQHRLEGATTERDHFRLANATSDVTVGNNGQLRIEWVADGELIGARFGVSISSNNSGVGWRYLGEIEYNRRTTGSKPTFVLANVNKGQVQYDTLTVLASVVAEHDGSTLVYVKFEPRGKVGAKITGLQFTFSV